MKGIQFKLLVIFFAFIFTADIWSMNDFQEEKRRIQDKLDFLDLKLQKLSLSTDVQIKTTQVGRQRSRTIGSKPNIKIKSPIKNNKEKRQSTQIFIDYELGVAIEAEKYKLERYLKELCSGDDIVLRPTLSAPYAEMVFIKLKKLAEDANSKQMMIKNLHKYIKSINSALAMWSYKAEMMEKFRSENEKLLSIIEKVELSYLGKSYEVYLCVQEKYKKSLQDYLNWFSLYHDELESDEEESDVDEVVNKLMDFLSQKKKWDDRLTEEENYLLATLNEARGSCELWFGNFDYIENLLNSMILKLYQARENSEYVIVTEKELREALEYGSVIDRSWFHERQKNLQLEVTLEAGKIVLTIPWLDTVLMRDHTYGQILYESGFIDEITVRHWRKIPGCHVEKMILKYLQDLQSKLIHDNLKRFFRDSDGKGKDDLIALEEKIPNKLQRIYGEQEKFLFQLSIEEEKLKINFSQQLELYKSNYIPYSEQYDLAVQIKNLILSKTGTVIFAPSIVEELGLMN